MAQGLPFRDAYLAVKNNLDQLASKNPDEALAAKRHLGAPLGLDFRAMDARARQVEAWAGGERKRMQACRKRLLG